MAVANPEDIFQVYRLRHDRMGNIQRQLAGRFCFEDDGIHVLEDYFGMLEGLEGPLDARKQKLIRSLQNSSYVDVVRAGDLQDGSRPDLLPEVDEPQQPGSGQALGGRGSVAATAAKELAVPPSVFDYHRPGMESPQCLEFHRPSGKTLLNGQVLTDEEVQQLLSNLEDGTAVLRYRDVWALPGVMKVETELQRMFSKADPEGEDIHGVLENLKAQGADPQHLQVLHRAIYGDPMVNDVGNKRAYADFLKRPREGVHVMMDANNFKSINDDLGHDVGDKAIKLMGGAMRQAMDETAGREQGKLFRFGGDEFAAHLPTYEHAAQFARALRSKLEAIPALAGTHRLSVSMGLGHTPQHADYALNTHAKGAKNAAVDALRRKPGQENARAPEALYAHSLVPGFEGAIPTAEKPTKATTTLQAPHLEAPHVATTPVHPAGPARPSVDPAVVEPPKPPTPVAGA